MTILRLVESRIDKKPPDPGDPRAFSLTMTEQEDPLALRLFRKRYDAGRSRPDILAEELVQRVLDFPEPVIFSPERIFQQFRIWFSIVSQRCSLSRHQSKIPRELRKPGKLGKRHRRSPPVISRRLSLAVQ